MKFVVELWNNYLKHLPNLLTTFAKIGFPVGALCVICYSLKIGFFPRDLSFGDGLLFMMTAVAAGLFLLLFVVSLLALGIFTSPVTKRIFLAIIFIINKFKKEKLQLYHKLAPFTWWSAILMLYAIFFIIAFGRQDSSAFYVLPTISVLMYFFYSIFQSHTEKLKDSETEKETNIVLSSNSALPKADTKMLKNGQIFSFIILIIIPLILSGVCGLMLDAVMRALHIRIESASILLKEPYSSLIDKTSQYMYTSDATKWFRFNDATVESTGFGKYTVISVKVKNEKVALEVPNDSIIIARDYQAVTKVTTNTNTYN